MTDAETMYAADWFSETSATFGDRLSGAREAIGLSQSELAARLGVKLVTLRGWEDDLNDPRANKLQMLSGILNVSITWLLTGQGEGVSPEDDNDSAREEMLAIMAEMRVLRGDLTELGTRLGTLEARLRSTLQK
jgi:transcriptional regulator with XRE-family HTH domain